MQFIEGLTSIRGLNLDPYFSGGSDHGTARRSFFGVRVDSRVNETLHLYRRLKLIGYLNEARRAQYGGRLELRDRAKIQRCASANTDTK